MMTVRPGSTSKQVTVTAPSGGISLNAVGYKVKGLQKANLTWTGAATAVDIYRNTVKIATATNGAYTDNINARGSATYTYRVCLMGGTSTCSNNVVVTF